MYSAFLVFFHGARVPHRLHLWFHSSIQARHGEVSSVIVSLWVIKFGVGAPVCCPGAGFHAHPVLHVRRHPLRCAQPRGRTLPCKLPLHFVLLKFVGFVSCFLLNSFFPFLLLYLTCLLSLPSVKSLHFFHPQCVFTYLSIPSTGSVVTKWVPSSASLLRKL